MVDDEKTRTSGQGLHGASARSRTPGTGRRACSLQSFAHGTRFVQHEGRAKVKCEHPDSVESLISCLHDA